MNRTCRLIACLIVVCSVVCLVGSKSTIAHAAGEKTVLLDWNVLGISEHGAELLKTTTGKVGSNYVTVGVDYYYKTFSFTETTAINLTPNQARGITNGFRNYKETIGYAISSSKELCVLKVDTDKVFTWRAGDILFMKEKVPWYISTFVTEFSSSNPGVMSIEAVNPIMRIAPTDTLAGFSGIGVTLKNTYATTKTTDASCAIVKTNTMGGTTITPDADSSFAQYSAVVIPGYVRFTSDTGAMSTGERSMQEIEYYSVLSETTHPMVSTKSLTYSSSNPSVASVDSVTGEVTALDTGTVTITATSTYTSVSQEYRVPYLKNTMVSSDWLWKSYTKEMTTTKYGQSGIYDTDPSKPLYNEPKLNQLYTQTSIKKITITKGVDSVSLDVTSLTLPLNSSAVLTPTVLPSDASNQSVTWSSSDEAIASVDATGSVTANKAGQAIITVTTVSGAKTAECLVTVLAPSKIVLTNELSVKNCIFSKVGVKTAAGEYKPYSETVYNNSYATANTMNDGVFVRFSMRNLESTTYQKGSAVLKTSSGVRLGTAPVYFSESDLRGRETTHSAGEWKTGYAYFDKAVLPDASDLTDCVLGIDITDYWNSACTDSTGLVAAATATLHIDTKKPEIADLTQATPGLNTSVVRVGEGVHNAVYEMRLRFQTVDSHPKTKLRTTQYAITNSPDASPDMVSASPDKNGYFTTPPITQNGTYYVHVYAQDYAGNEHRAMFGPYTRVFEPYLNGSGIALMEMRSAGKTHTYPGNGLPLSNGLELPYRQGYAMTLRIAALETSNAQITILHNGMVIPVKTLHFKPLSGIEDAEYVAEYRFYLHRDTALPDGITLGASIRLTGLYPYPDGHPLAGETAFTQADIADVFLITGHVSDDGGTNLTN